MNTSSFDKKPATFPNKIIKIMKIIAAAFLGIYLIIWAISSPVSKYFIKPILLEQGVILSTDSSISYNPFLSQLSVSNLTLFSNNDIKEKVLSISELKIRLTLFRLLFDKIVVSKFELNDAYLKVVKTPSQLIIAGIDLNKKTVSTAPEEKPEQESEPLLYQLLLPELALNKFIIDIENDDKAHEITIKKLLISQVKADQNVQTALLNLESDIDATALEIQADVNFEQGQGEINSKLSLANYPIKKLQPYIKDLSELSGMLTLSSKQQIKVTPEKFDVHISQADISNIDLLVGIQEQFFNLEKMENSINDLKLTLDKGEITELSGTSQLTLNNAHIYHGKPNQKLGYFKQLALKDISFHFIDEPQVKISSLVIDEILGSENGDTEHPPLVTLKQFNISEILISEKALSINKIVLDSLQSDVIIDTDKALANLVDLPKAEAENEEVEVPEDIDKEQNSKKSDFIISLNEFSLVNDNQVSMLDNSVEPVKQRKLFIDTLHLGAISNAKDKQNEQTPFELIGRSNKYAHFNFKGYAQPFSQKPQHHIEGSLNELSLPAVSRYMKQAMQMELKSGQLNTDVNVTLTGDELDGNVVILLRGLETAIADSDEAGALIDQGALPFNMALGMLKDSKGDVELDVPLSGSTSDPSFGMSSIVTLITQKAIWMATQDYLMTTFVPYANIVSVAMTVGEFALKLRFDDLIYQVKQIEPNEAQQAYLKAFIGLMQEKEDTRVNICAISTSADIDLNAGSKLNKEQSKQLKEIAEQREVAFKEYMIKNGGIASSRLLLCAPKIDNSDEAKPRIELSV
jgi:hypothetical protein